MFFFFVLYSSEKKHENFFTKSLDCINNNFFNEHRSFHCDSYPVIGQRCGLYSLYGIKSSLALRNNHNKHLNIDLEKNFNDVKSGHFPYALSGILFRFLPMLYLVKVTRSYSLNMNEKEKEEYNEHYNNIFSYVAPKHVIKKSRDKFDFPEVFILYTGFVKTFFDEIENYIKHGSQLDIDISIKKLYDNKNRIEKYYKWFEFLFDKTKREKEIDKLEQEKIYTHIDENYKSLIERLRKYTEQEDLLSKEEFQEMTKILWDVF